MDYEIEQAARGVADQIDVPQSNWLAVVEVESGGQAFATVDGKQEPVMRFEGHLFYRLLGPGAKRDAAVRAGLAAQKWGVVKNPRSQQARWDKLIRPAMRIDRVAALSACSVGLGQVLLSHWKAFGMESVDKMLASAGTVEGQLLLMARFCQVNHAVDEIQRGDWAGFARIYNGPAYARNRYDVRLAEAAKRFGGITDARDDHLLRVGSEGAKVREVQALLRRAGYLRGEVDGDYGQATRDAVKEFQTARGLSVDGKVGPETWTALIELRQSPDERPGVPGAAESVVETKEGRQGAGTAITGVGAGGAASQVQDVADKVSGVGGDWTDYIATVLYAVAGVLIVAGLVWMAWGWIKARRD